MATPTGNPDPENKPLTPVTNGMSEEQFAAMLAHIERRKNDTEYFRSWDEGVAEFRKKLQEELERELAELEATGED